MNEIKEIRTFENVERRTLEPSCSPDCLSVDCRARELMSRTDCPGCGEPLGFVAFVKFESEGFEFFAHAGCFNREEKRRSRR